ncbi:MAG: DMT family transporter [Candidatus Binatia bacterium]
MPAAPPSSDPRLRGLALGAVAVAVLTWGFSNVMIKVVSTTGLVASFYRLWFAIPLLWLLPLAMPSVRRRLDRAWLSGALIGGSLFALHQVLFFTSLKLTTVANVSLIGALQPPLVLLVAGRWFGERASRRTLAWSMVAVAGAVMVVLGSAGAPGWSPLGDLIAVANLFAFTAYFLASKRIRETSGTTEYLLGLTTVAGLFILAANLLTGQQLTSPRGNDWLILFSLALFPGTLGHFLTNWAHPHTSAFVVSIIFLAVPVLACIGAAVVLDEVLGPLQVVGALVLLSGVAAVVLSTPRGDDLAESAAETDAP